MNWTTLYITGRVDFREDVWKKLQSGKVDIMPGYLDSSTANGLWDLYWVNEKFSLREVKEAIGGKLIWKYRLKFFRNIEEAEVPWENLPAFSAEERELLESMRKSA